MKFDITLGETEHNLRSNYDESILCYVYYTRRAGALRRARLLPVFAPCLLMRYANSAIIRLIVPFRALL
jgi:hypothetical protein